VAGPFDALASLAAQGEGFWLVGKCKEPRILSRERSERVEGYGATERCPPLHEESSRLAMISNVSGAECLSFNF
jgi:hypothetical protein